MFDSKWHDVSEGSILRLATYIIKCLPNLNASCVLYVWKSLLIRELPDFVVVVLIRLDKNFQSFVVCSDDEMMYDDKVRDESEKYQDKGVEDEEGLRKIVESGDEDEEDEEKKDEENEDEEESRAKDGKEKGNQTLSF